MLEDSEAFSSIAVSDIGKAKTFYEDVLGLEVSEDEMGLTIKLASGNDIFMYTKPDHEPATYTVLNFPVDDIDEAVTELAGKGVEFEQYDNEPVKTDEKGIARGKEAGQGPDIAWFRDPAGNILSVLES